MGGLTPGDQDLYTHTSTGISWGQRHKAEASGSPRDCCVCSCAVAMARPQTMHCWVGAGAGGSKQTMHRGAPLPLLAVQGGASEMKQPWAGIYQGLSKPLAPARELSQMHGDRSDRVLTTHASLNSSVQEELQRSGWQTLPASACTYLLSARSVLLPTSMMITSLPLSVLTSSIHLEVCWKELRSGDGKWG